MIELQEEEQAKYKSNFQINTQYVDQKEQDRKIAAEKR
jgi:hypothetical protein